MLVGVVMNDNDSLDGDSVLDDAAEAIEATESTVSIDAAAADDSGRRGTSTSSFGVSRRESHDASGFYERFTPPTISKDEHVERAVAVDEIFHGDAIELLSDDRYVADNSVALMVTSPPYFAGKAYEEDMTRGHVPESYAEYLAGLEAMFEVCARKLEPGGRMAINVANLGRKPYRSLSADVIDILQRLGLLLRGEIIWLKGDRLGGSCAWGSFQSPANPVLRDVTERVIVASKGRFDRAVARRKRASAELPSESSLFSEDFTEFTTDLWTIQPESATRVGHPAPFPIELPQRLIDLYTYRDDLVLDPYMGSGTTAVAAMRRGRHFVGFDTEPEYVEAATARLDRERARLDDSGESVFQLRLPAVPEPADPDEDPHARAVREGRKAKDIAFEFLRHLPGLSLRGRDVKRMGSVEIDFDAATEDGQSWYFDVSGGFTSGRAGLRRTDTVWKALGRAALCLPREPGQPKVNYVLLTTHLPPKGSAGWKAIVEAQRSGLIFDAIDMLSSEGREQVRRYIAAGGDAEAVPVRPPVVDG